MMNALMTALVLVSTAMTATPVWALQSESQAETARGRFALGRDAAKPLDEAEVGSFKISRETGAVTADYDPRFTAKAGTPEEMAREFLATRAGELRLDPSLADLEHHSTTETPGGFRVRYLQKISGLEVEDAALVVSLDRNQNVVFYMSNYVPAQAVTRSRAAWSLSPAEGAARASARFGRSLRSVRGQAEKIWAVEGGRMVPAYRVLTDAASATWRSVVDANSGNVLRVTSETHNDGERLDATGMVFNPDPLTKNRKTADDAGFGDGNDADTAELNASRMQVTLKDVTREGGLIALKGPYAQINDSESPRTGVYSQASDQFMFNRNQYGFEAVNVYFHIDQSMRYINETLRFPLRPYQYSGGVLADPYGLNGDDNSHYSSSSGMLAFGQGGVDDAEDEDVILHELGHGLHDWLTRGNLSQVQGLSEGSGDYWAASYNRSLGLWTKADPQYYWTFQWDGHNEYWPGRVLNVTGTYPRAASGAIHTAGQLWATTLMEIYDVIGREATDRNFLEALSMLSRNANQLDAANAFVRADKNLYQGEHLTQIVAAFQARGYNVVAP